MPYLPAALQPESSPEARGAEPRASSAAADPAPRLARPGFLREVGIYVGRIRLFTPTDWAVYLSWVGLMFGLVFATGGFLLVGHLNGVRYPLEAWLLPIGAVIFAISIAIDTIGHRTIYKEEISKAEGLVHHITIFSGISACVLLCLAYSLPGAVWIVAMVMTALSFLYSLIDEAFHWRRYVQADSDRVEMWSHVGILTGHSILMIAWWWWFFRGYPGVAETLPYLAF
jgi:hypothetical protein